MTAAFDQSTIEEYTRAKNWDERTLADFVANNCITRGDKFAFISHDASLTWREYDELSTRLAGAYVDAGWSAGEVIAVLMTGGAAVHVAYLAAQKAGLVILGIGPRAGVGEIKHLLAKSGARKLVTRPLHRGRPAGELVADLDIDLHLMLHLDGTQLSLATPMASFEIPNFEQAQRAIVGRALSANEIFFLNSTSGTTGLPKCVMQTMNTRKYFGQLAVDAGNLGANEVFLSALPAPFGFGQWSAHVVPTMFGYTTVLPDEFSAEATLHLIAEHRVTVLASVTSQFVMMLNSPEFHATDMSSLRVLFTGGEKVPFVRAAEFEEQTGCSVLQFYGSNEAGPISVTSVADDKAHRLGTAGRAIPDMNIRLFAVDEVGTDVTTSGGPGQCATRGPGLTPGYFNDEEANSKLIRPDGWMLTGDIVRIDSDGYLSITGRATDFIIRGGQNISTLAVEAAISSCARVKQVAVVSRPDEILGERVCAYVVTRDGQDLSLEELQLHLKALEFSKHSWPEWLATLPEIPLSTGAKVDRAWLRQDALARFPARHP
jgi:acyl-CoA synthetase